MGRRHRSVALRMLAGVTATLAALALPAGAAAHPLGNFTINHYAEVRIERDRILLDIVIDHAEIPTFQARQELDGDTDGLVSPAETEAARVAGCEAVAGDVTLEVRRRPIPLVERLVGAGLAFPLGAGGLSTMRQVCVFVVPLETPIGEAAVPIAFSDGSFAERLGWREIVARGSAVELTAVDGQIRDASVSERLTAYPEGMVTTPPADERIELAAVAGGPSLGAFVVPDADAVPGAVFPVPAAAAGGTATAPPIATPSASSAPGPVTTAAPVTVPGGISGEVPAIFRTSDLTPVVLLFSLVTAAALGAGHALTPGHGKTLMAAYLVGTRGSVRHALGLGVAVSVSHTLGILGLAAVVVGAAGVVAPDLVVRWAPVVAALSILAIGGWMLIGELRRRSWRARSGHTPAHRPGHDDDHAHDDHSHDDHPHDAHHHHHRHDHAPPGSTITWKGLFALGLAGGLIPSTSALLILLGAIAAGRPAFGFVLVVAFGLGMATVMAGIGLVLVLARERVERVDVGPGFERIRATVPFVAAVIVVGFGALLTVQALSAVEIV